MSRIVTAAFIALMLASSPARAELKTFTLTLKDHVFTPEIVEVPRGERITLVIRNEDATSEKFESHDLKREKIIGAEDEVRLHVGPLKPGTYKFFGEDHADTAHGKLIVNKPQKPQE